VIRRRDKSCQENVIMGYAYQTIRFALVGLMPAALVACGQPQQTVVLQQQPQQMSAPVTVLAGPGMLPASIARAFPVQGSAFTPHPGRAPTQQEMESIGESIRPNGQVAGCNVDLVLNRDQFLSNVPRLGALGLLNQQISPQQAQVQILSVSMAFTLQAASIAAHEFLQQPGAPFGCHFRQAITIPGAGGGSQLLPMFEFDMTRAVDAQAPWPRLLTAGFSYNDANQFVSAAPNFHLAPGVVDRIRQENFA
jgi:hypothetical protein